MSEQKVIVAGWYTVDPKRRDEVVESFKDLVLRARSAPGCLDLAITADPVESNRINLFELWESEEALNAWRAVSRAPKKMAPILRMDMQKHIIQKSGSPFQRWRPASPPMRTRDQSERRVSRPREPGASTRRPIPAGEPATGLSGADPRRPR
jgi:quinol monooxygenase YgiN